MASNLKFKGALLALSFVLFPLARGAAQAPANLGLGLRQLAETYQQDPTRVRAQLSSMKNAQINSAQQVTVNIHLDGSQRAEDVAAKLRDLGVQVRAINTEWRNGIIAAHLPVGQAAAVAAIPGVRSVMLAPKPHRRIGRVTAESSEVERAAEVNQVGFLTAQGILGRGITVGVMSDSFDKATGVPRASVAVASGDLPGPGNPNGYTQPVEVIADSTDSDATDEGRGMSEIVHDIAPAAKIEFATSGDTDAEMANNIEALLTHGSNIIVDDIYFYDEPFFSDGVIAQSVEKVTTGLGAQHAAYFSAAGNAANLGYLTTFRELTPAQATAAQGPVKLSTAPAYLWAGGIHNLNATGAPAIAMPIETYDADDSSDTSTTLIMQWNDPFDTGGVTTDYNLLVFDSKGNYVASISGVDSNFSTDEPIEEVDLKKDTNYYLVIALASAPPPTATHLWIISVDGSEVTSPYIGYNAPTLYGHPAATDADAVGAYVYNNAPNQNASYNPAKTNPPPGTYRPALEDFTSNGGNLAFYFDAHGNRLTTPVLRAKPNFAAADGVDTTFFPPGADMDYDNDRFPNFFGTSAAAPTAAAIGALMLEAAGGPTSLTQAQIRTKLEQTTFVHDLDPFFSEALASSGPTTVTVSATGNDSDVSSSSPRFFGVSVTGGTNTLNQLQINLTNAGLYFDANASTGFPFTVDPASSPGVTVSSSLSVNRQILTLNFSNTFHPGETIYFGIDRDFASASGGNSADYLAGADIVATFANGATAYGGFGNKLGRGFTFVDGYGLVDAEGAVQSIVNESFATGYPRNISTRALVGTGNNVLIGGFIIQDGSKKVFVRALGPSLAASGVQGVLSNPILELHNANGTLIAIDDNWQDSSTQAAQIKAAGLAPSDPRESALVETLAAGNYTGIVRGVGGTTGNALVEVYDGDAAGSVSQLANISSRGLVETGDSVMIGGFIVGGNATANVVVRALGPSLATSGLAGVLADPYLELHDGNGNIIMTNDNWQQDSAQAIQIAADGLAPTNPLESAAAITLKPGNYTAIVRGAQGTTGIGLVEMYNIR